MDLRQYGGLEGIFNKDGQPIKHFSEITPEIEAEIETKIRKQMKEHSERILAKYPDAVIGRELFIWEKDEIGLWLGWYREVVFS